MQGETILRYLFSPIRLAQIKSACAVVVRQWGNGHCRRLLGAFKLVQPLWKAVWGYQVHKCTYTLTQQSHF